MTGIKFARSFIAGATLLVSVSAQYAQAEPLEIEFWTTDTEPSRVHRIEYLMNAFTAFNEDIRVRVVGVDENELLNRFHAAEKAGAAPVVIDADSGLLSKLADAGKLDTQSSEQVIGGIGEDRFFRAPLRAVSMHDGATHFAVPFHGWVQALWYRADWFKTAGLPKPDSFEAILAAAAYFTDPVQSRYGIVLGTAGDIYEDQIRAQLARADGRELNSLASGTAPPSETEEYYEQLSKFAPDGPGTVKTRDVYLQGRAAMIFYSSFLLGHLARVSKSDNDKANVGRLASDIAPANVFDIAGNTEMQTVIVNKTRGTYGVLNGLALTRQAKTKVSMAGRKLIAFIFQPDVYIQWLHMAPGGMLPIIRDIANSDAFYRDPKGIFRRFGWQQIQSLVNTFDEKSLLLVQSDMHEKECEPNSGNFAGSPHAPLRDSDLTTGQNDLGARKDARRARCL